MGGNPSKFPEWNRGRRSLVHFHVVVHPHIGPSVHVLETLTRDVSIVATFHLNRRPAEKEGGFGRRGEERSEGLNWAKGGFEAMNGLIAIEGPIECSMKHPRLVRERMGRIIKGKGAAVV